MKLINTIEEIKSTEPNDDEEMKTPPEEQQQQEWKVEVVNKEGQWEELTEQEEETNEPFRVDEVVYYNERDDEYSNDIKMDGGVRFDVQYPDEEEGESQDNDNNQEDNDNRGGNSFEDEYQSQIEIPPKSNY